MDPNSGTFLSIDPLVPDAFDPQSMNAFSYARNNPVSNVDPTGMCPAAIMGGSCAPPPPPGMYVHTVTADPTGGIPWYVYMNGTIMGLKGHVARSTAYEPEAFAGVEMLGGGYQTTQKTGPNEYTTSYYQGSVKQAGFVPGVAWLWRFALWVPAVSTLISNMVRLRLDKALTKPIVSSPGAQNLVNSLFKATDRIPGGTAEAIRHTARTGELVRGADHIRKGVEAVNRITKLQQSGQLNPLEARNLGVIQQDLLGALGAAQKAGIGVFKGGP